MVEAIGEEGETATPRAASDLPPSELADQAAQPHESGQPLLDATVSVADGEELQSNNEFLPQSTHAAMPTNLEPPDPPHAGPESIESPVQQHQVPSSPSVHEPGSVLQETTEPPDRAASDSPASDDKAKGARQDAARVDEPVQNLAENALDPDKGQQVPTASSHPECPVTTDANSNLAVQTEPLQSGENDQPQTNVSQVIEQAPAAITELPSRRSARQAQRRTKAESSKDKEEAPSGQDQDGKQPGQQNYTDDELEGGAKQPANARQKSQEPMASQQKQPESGAHGGTYSAPQNDAEQQARPVVSAAAAADTVGVGSVLWAKLKGYPHWPAQVMSQEATNKRLKGQAPKGQRLPIMFFGTREVAWVPHVSVTLWEKGLQTKFGDMNNKKDKRLLLGFQEASEFVKTGQIPKKWWQKTEASPAQAPASKRRKVADTRKSVAELQKDIEGIKTTSDAERPGDQQPGLENLTPPKVSGREAAGGKAKNQAKGSGTARMQSKKQTQRSKPQHKPEAETEEAPPAERASKRLKISPKRFLEPESDQDSDENKIVKLALGHRRSSRARKEAATATGEIPAVLSSPFDFPVEDFETDAALTKPSPAKRPGRPETKRKARSVGGILKSKAGKVKKVRASLPSQSIEAPLEDLLAHGSFARRSKRAASALPPSSLQLLADSEAVKSEGQPSASVVDLPSSAKRPQAPAERKEKPWEAVTVQLIANEKLSTVRVKFARKKRRYTKSGAASLPVVAAPESSLEAPQERVRVQLIPVDNCTAVRLMLSYPKGRAASRHSSAPHRRMENDTGRRPSQTSAGLRLDINTLPGGQAPLLPCATAAPPNYIFARKNIWTGNLPRPKRLLKDSISMCDCHPSTKVSAGEGANLLGDEALAAKLGADRGLRARAKGHSELGKLNCGPDCMNRQSFIHCDPKVCPCGEQCSNQPFHKLPIARVEAFHTGDRGWGVRATEAIPSGAFIVEYTGELLSKIDKQRRLEEQARQQIMDFYMMEHSSGVIIDARLKGNLARLINSSCDPNCETQKWRDAATEECRVGIFTKRDVPAGEELSYDYNFEHSGLAEAAGAYRCKCGAANCRGTMDTQPDRLKDAYRRIDIFWDADRMFYRGTVHSYQAATNMHNIYYDDGQKAKERLAAMRHRWLPDDAEMCFAGLPEDSLPDIAVVQPMQQLPANSPSMVRSRRGGRPRGRRKKSGSMQMAQQGLLLRDLQEPLLYDSFDDSKEVLPESDTPSFLAKQELPVAELDGNRNGPVQSPLNGIPAANPLGVSLSSVEPQPGEMGTVSPLEHPNALPLGLISSAHQSPLAVSGSEGVSAALRTRTESLGDEKLSLLTSVPLRDSTEMAQRPSGSSNADERDGLPEHDRPAHAVSGQEDIQQQTFLAAACLDQSLGVAKAGPSPERRDPEGDQSISQEHLCQDERQPSGSALPHSGFEGLYRQAYLTLGQAHSLPVEPFPVQAQNSFANNDDAFEQQRQHHGSESRLQDLPKRPTTNVMQ